MSEEEKPHTFSILVENRFGALARIAGLFSGRGYNIESLSVNHTLDPNVSCMTIVTKGNEEVLEQIEKQLNKLIDVVSVEDITLASHIERGLILMRVKADHAGRCALIQILESFQGRILEMTPSTVSLELSGSPEQLDSFIEIMKEFGILELSRAGRTAIRRC